MTKPENCFKEEVLVPMVLAGKLEEVRIIQDDEGMYVVSVKLNKKRERMYLATRRNPDEPRRFARLETAISTAQQLFNTKRFLVLLK